MLEILKSVYPTFTSLGLLASLTYIIVKEFRSGSNDVEKKTFASYKERNEQLEQEIPRLHSEMKSLGEKLANLTGVVGEKDKHIKSLTEILQGRNPEVITILTDIKDLNNKIIEFMHQVDSSTKTILEYQTKMLEKQINITS